jgi:hypothetical protein
MLWSKGLFFSLMIKVGMSTDEVTQQNQRHHKFRVSRGLIHSLVLQVGEEHASSLYASGAGHYGSALPAPRSGQGAAATVQILRSIDGRSAQLDQGRPFPVLHHKKGRPVEASILSGYIHHIRRARYFLYIENQYFMGSSYMWAHDRAVGCSHIIPAEITTKICHKIRCRESFVVYVVIPLHPEGPPVRACLCSAAASTGLRSNLCISKLAFCSEDEI